MFENLWLVMLIVVDQAARAAGGPPRDQGDARLLRGLHVRLQGRGQDVGPVRHRHSPQDLRVSDQRQVRHHTLS